MKDNEVVEVLEDGTIHYYDLDVCEKEAHKLLDALYDKQGKIPNFELVAAAYTVMVEMVQLLHHSGAPLEELLEIVVEHAVDLPFPTEPPEEK